MPLAQQRKNTPTFFRKKKLSVRAYEAPIYLKGVEILTKHTDMNIFIAWIRLSIKKHLSP